MKYYGIKTIIETKSDIYNPYQKYNFTWAKDTNTKKKAMAKTTQYFEVKDRKMAISQLNEILWNKQVTKETKSEIYNLLGVQKNTQIVLALEID